MKFFRLFAGSDHLSHFEDLDVRLEDINATTGDDASVGRIWNFLHICGIEGASLLRKEGGADSGYHTAPRRYMVIYLAGSREYFCGNGESRIVGPGDILLAEDTTGRGHYSRSVSEPQEILLVYISPDVIPERIFSMTSGLPGRQAPAA
jgi:hypothetical protein